MATSSETLHDPDYVDFDEYIDIQLRKTGSTIKLTDVLTAVVGVSTLITAYLLTFVICDHWLIPGGFGPLAREVMLVMVAALSVGWIVVKVLLPWRRRVSGLYAASTIEKASPNLKSSLLNLVDLSRSEREVLPEIRGSLERRAALALTHLDVAETVDRRSLLRLSMGLLAVVVLFCLYWVISPKNPGTSLWRALVPTSRQTVATRTEIYLVRPGDVDVIVRSQLDVTAELRGEIPPQAWLYFTTADQKFVDERIEMRLVDDSAKQFRCVINGENGAGILQNMDYRIAAGDSTSGPYKIRVIQPPSATIESIRLDFPEYTLQESVTQSGGSIDAVEGTRVTLKARANMPLAPRALLQFFDDQAATKRSDEIPIHVADGTKLEVQWKLELRSDGGYPHFFRVFCTNTNGEADPNPSVYSLTIRPDLPPEVVLRDPKTDLSVPANAVLPLVVEARDPDFRLRYVRLNVVKNGSPILGPDLFDGTKQPLRQSFKTTFDWSLKDFHFRPNDTVTYWLQAQDNREPLANTTNTPKLNLRIVDPVSQEQANKNLQQAKDRQKEEARRGDSDPSKDQEAQNDEKNTGSKHSGKGNKEPQQDQQQDPNGQQQQNQPAEGREGDSADNAQNQTASAEQNQREERNKQGNSSRPGREQKPSLDPNSSADDAKALQKLLDQQNREKQRENGSGAGGNGPKPADNQTKSEQNSGPSERQNNNQPGSDSDAAVQPNSRRQEKTDAGDGAGKNGKDGVSKGAGAKPSPDKKSAEQQPGGQQQQSQQHQTGKDRGDQPRDVKPGTDGSKPKDNAKSPGSNEAASQADGAGKQPEAGRKPEADHNQDENGSSDPKTASRPDASARKDRAATENPSNENKDESKTRQQPTAQPSPKSQETKDQHSGEAGEQQPSGQAPETKPKNGSTASPGKSDVGKNDLGKNDAGKNDAGKSDAGKNDAGSTANGPKPEESRTGAAKENKKPDQGAGANDHPGANDGSTDENRQNENQNSNGSRPSEKNQPGKKQSDNKQPDDKRPAGTPSKEDRTDGKPQAKNQSAGKDGQPGERDKGTAQAADNPVTKGRAPQDANRKQIPPKDNAASDEARNESGERGPKPAPGDKKPEDKNAKPDNTHQPNQDVAPRDTPQSPQAVKSARRPHKGVDDPSLPADAQRDNQSPKVSEDKQQFPSNADEQAEPGANAPKKSSSQQSRENGSPNKSPQTESPQGGAPKSDGQQSDNSNQSTEKRNPQQDRPPKEGSGEPKAGNPQSNSEQQGKPGGKQDSNGVQGKSSNQGSAGKQSNQAASKGGSPKSNSDGKQGGAREGNARSDGGGGNNGGTSQGSGDPLEDTRNKANLDYAKNAVDLVLNKLDDQLKRGTVDKKMMEELGWNQQQIRQFVERMRKAAQNAQRPSPVDEAHRQQFLETLRSLDLTAPAKRRTNKGIRKTKADEIGATRPTPPAEYRDLYEEFTRSLSGSGAAKKK